jgi:hypothetical protein
MKKSTLVLIGLLASIGVETAAVAADVSPSTSSAPIPGLTRAEVKAETLRALAAHEIPFGEAAYPVEPNRTPVRAAKARATSQDPARK